MNAQDIIARIEDHCRKAGISATTFGRRTVNDGKLVARLRAGRPITTTTLERIETAIRPRLCPECGEPSPASAPACACGHAFAVELSREAAA
jgi:hypothetical protein